MRKKLLAVVATALVAIGTAAAAAVPAHAGVDDVSCAGTASASYSPGLTNTPRATSFSLTDSYAACGSTDSSITSGSDGTSFDLPSADCGALTAGGYVETVTWSNGQQSQIFFGTTEVDLQVGIVLQATGQVISGEFTGDTASQENVYPLTDLGGCDSPQGLTSLTGTVDLVLTSV